VGVGVGVGVGTGAGVGTTVLLLTMTVVSVDTTPLVSVTLGKTTVPPLVGSLVAPLASLIVTLSAA